MKQKNRKELSPVRELEEDTSVWSSPSSSNRGPYEESPGERPPPPIVPKSSPDDLEEISRGSWTLQQQLKEARTENKLLKRDLRLHMVALQHYQDPQIDITEIITKQKKETKNLRKLLKDTCVYHDHLAKQLEATGEQLEATWNNLQQLLRKPPSQMEKLEELTQRLAETTEELQEKDRKIQSLERKLEMRRSSFKFKLLKEKEKNDQARTETSQLQKQVDRLTRTLKKKEKQLEKIKGSSRSFSRETCKKADETLQTDGVDFILQSASPKSERVCFAARRPKRHQTPVTMLCDTPVEGSFLTENPQEKIDPAHPKQKKLQDDPQEFADSSVHFKDDEFKTRSLPRRFKRSSAPKNNSPEKPHVPEQKQKSEDGASGVDPVEKCPTANQPKKKERKRDKIRHDNTCQETTENLFSERPASPQSLMKDSSRRLRTIFKQLQRFPKYIVQTVNS